MDQPLSGYPSFTSNKRMLVTNHFGPTSYTTGGETVAIRPLGMGGADWVGQWANSLSGLYYGMIFLPAKLGPVSQVTIQWFEFAGGGEVANGTNLSAETLRLAVIGV